tara:strand:- start:1654 stop:2805 length:1152 start_codon:yes stop_codon:yes gene_type:complete
MPYGDNNINHQSVQLHLRSDDPDLATDATDSEVKFIFRRIVNIPPELVVNISVLSAQIPNTFYVIDRDLYLTWRYDNVAPFTVPPVPSIPPDEILLPKGTYTPCSFAKTIDALLKDLHPTNHKFFSKWEDGIDCITLKWKLPAPTGLGVWCFENCSYTSGGTFLPFDDDNSRHLRKMFGVEFFTLDPTNPNYIGNLTSTSGWNSPFIPDFTGHHNIYIGCNLITGSLDSLEGGLENTLCKVPVSAPYGSIIHYNGESRTGALVQREFLSEIVIQIQDHHNQLIDLNGVRWNMTLLIEFIPRTLPDGEDPDFEQFPQAIPLSARNEMPYEMETPERLRESLIKKRLKSWISKFKTPKQIDTEIANIDKTSLMNLTKNTPPLPPQ